MVSLVALLQSVHTTEQHLNQCKSKIISCVFMFLLLTCISVLCVVDQSQVVRTAIMVSSVCVRS